MTSNNDHVYDDCFFDRLTAESLASAKVIVPLLLNLIPPRSVIDIGCGQGAWLKVFKEYGVEVTLGLDGPWVNPSKLLIDKDNFRPVDLSQPFEVAGSYDLGMCLEVAEHLPKSSADGLICSLVKLAPVIVFSAGIPLQGGTHHINEQWPDYWEERFRQHNYRLLDPIRPLIYKNDQVSWWYRQNIFLYVREDAISGNPTLRDAAEWSTDMTLLHCSVLQNHLALRSVLKRLPTMILEAACRRIKRVLRAKAQR